MNEKQPVPLRDQESIDEFLSKIPHAYEREFALLLLRIPTLDIWYEPTTLTGIYKEKERTTKPDFFVINTKNPTTRGVFIEVTSSKNRRVTKDGWSIDPKACQREILSQNSVKHIILYRQNLRYIEKYRDDVAFQFKTKTI